MKVIKGVGLKAINPYVVLSVPSFNDSSILTSIKKTTVKYNNANPEWNEEFTLYFQDSYMSFEILVRDVKTVCFLEFNKVILLNLFRISIIHTTKQSLMNSNIIIYRSIQHTF